MIIDCNAFIGNFAFRRLRRNDTAGVLGMMDQFGIDRACVASADAILYKDCQAGNEKLFEETRGHDDRFWLYATLNPAYAGWQRDLATCVELGFRAVRLYPYYHDYTFDSPEAGALIDAAAEAGLVVSVPCRVVDLRQRHWMDATENLDPRQALDVAEAHPKARFLLTESILSWPEGSDSWKRMRGLRFHVEMSRMASVLQRSIQAAIEALGPERVLFGTGFPFKAPSPALLKVQVLDADERAKSRISGLNAAELFGS